MHTGLRPPPVRLPRWTRLLAWCRRQRRRRVPGTDATEALRALSRHEFEQLLGEAFRLNGYRVVQATPPAPDGSVTLVLHKGGEKRLVHCASWRAQKVGTKVVQALHANMAAQRACAGVVVTTGCFTAEAQAFTQGRAVTLVDGPALLRLLRPAQAARQRPAASRAAFAPAVAPAAVTRPGTAQLVA